MPTTISSAAILDGVAQVIAGAIPDSHIHAAGVTQWIIDAVPLVVPIADDFLEASGGAAVLCTLGEWRPTLQPGTERYGSSNPLVVHCSVWRERGTDLGQTVNLLLGDRDRIADSFIAHTKAYLAVPALQAAILAGGPGIVPRSIGEDPSRAFLTLPFDVNVTLSRPVIPQPA